MVFIGGAAYGAMLPILRVAYNHGFNPVNSMVIQNLFAVIILAVLSITLVRTKPKLSQIFGLLGAGVSAFVMSTAFFFTLRYASATITVILLFQYIWMGIAIQAILERRMPHPLTLLSGAIIIFGTVLTTGAFEKEVSLNVIGLVTGLLSALGYAVFLFLSGRVATDIPTVNRTAFVAVARFVLALALIPLFPESLSLPSPPLVLGFGLLLAFGGIVFPLLLIQGGAPHLPNSVTTIMSASELPSAVILAAILLGEVITPLAWLGIALVLGGIVLSQAPELAALSKRLRGRV